MWRTLCVAAAAIGLLACGQGGTVQGKVSDAKARNDGPPLWVVKDHDSTLYLYGTVHLLPPELSWQRDDMRAAFDAAGTIFFELDTSDKAQLQASILTQQLGQQPSGARLSSRLDSYQLKLLEAASHNGDIPLAVLDTMKPWLASEFLTVAAADGAGLSADVAADEALKSRAMRDGKNIIYLDGMEAQIRASADQPEGVQISVLTDTLENYSRLGADMASIAQNWAAGDVKALAGLSAANLKDSAPTLYKSLIIDRNTIWTGEFLRFLEGSGTGFAAVGVSHLLGEDSVQNMLRDQGYIVSRYFAFQGETVIKTAPLGSINPANQE